MGVCVNAASVDWEKWKVTIIGLWGWSKWNTSGFTDWHLSKWSFWPLRLGGRGLTCKCWLEQTVNSFSGKWWKRAGPWRYSRMRPWAVRHYVSVLFRSVWTKVKGCLRKNTVERAWVWFWGESPSDQRCKSQGGREVGWPACALLLEASSTCSVQPIGPHGPVLHWIFLRETQHFNFMWSLLIFNFELLKNILNSCVLTN